MPFVNLFGKDVVKSAEEYMLVGTTIEPAEKTSTIGSSQFRKRSLNTSTIVTNEFSRVQSFKSKAAKTDGNSSSSTAKAQARSIG